MKSKYFKKNLINFASKRVLPIMPLCLFVSAMFTLNIEKPMLFTENSVTLANFPEAPSSLSQHLTVSTEEILSSDAMEYMVAANLNQLVNTAVIVVNGKEMVSVATIEDAEIALEELLKDEIDKTGASEADFVQDIQISMELGNENYIKTIDEAKDILLGSEQTNAVHIVKSGETLSVIAGSYNISSSEINGLNPDVEPTKIQIGQEIIVRKAAPVISVQTTIEETYIEKIPYQTETQDDDTLTTTQKRTITAGVEGENQIVASVTYVDGVETTREVLSSTNLSQPTNALVAVGTKQPISNGTFIMPAKGTLTSPYGYRSSGFHSGIDIANSSGTPIYAADGGTVTFSGWYGGYGYCVIIDHGNGFTTLYGHASSLSVSKGDKVSQGDYIMAMGTTGNSTGNHLHFEIRVNGVHQNPYNYL